MTDIINDFLQQVEATRGDPHAQAALAAEFALSACPEAEQAPLRTALDVSALLHWFDADLLRNILALSEEEASERFQALKKFPFVEYYRRSESELLNIHESTRLGWRKKLARDDQGRFRNLSNQAAAYFAHDLTTSGRIEWIYHLLCAQPEQGASELEDLMRVWFGIAHHEDFYALALALQELEDSQLLNNRARAWTLIAIAWSRSMHGETAQLANIAGQIISLAKETEDQAADSEAQELLGDAMEAQGKLEAALAAFKKSLAFRLRRVESNSSNAGWQRDLGVAHSRVGDVLQAQGKLEAAQAAFEQCLAI